MSKVCQKIGVSRSEYYRKGRKVNSEKKSLEKAVVDCFRENRARYGRVRIRKALLERGIAVSEQRIARILRENRLRATTGRKSWKKKNKEDVVERVTTKNLVEDKFEVSEPNRLWCSDINEMKCRGCKVYTCAVIDVATRRIVGWDIQRHMRQEIAQRALQMAINTNPKRPSGSVYHTDGGAQFTAILTVRLALENGFLKSQSAPGHPWENQPIESFWNTLEREIGDISGLSFESAKAVIIDYIENYYNSRRLHSGINYKVPNIFYKKLTVLCA